MNETGDAICTPVTKTDDGVHADDFTSSVTQSAKRLQTQLESFVYNMGSRRSATKMASTIGTVSKTTPRAEPATSTTTPVTRAMTKRSAEEDATEASLPVRSKKKKRTTTKQRSAGDPYQVQNNLVDSLRPGLVLVFIGLNPGLTTAATGHAYSHASNLFWKMLHWSGITPVRHVPSDTHNLMDLYSIGNTNICERPTRSGDGLSKQELEAGAHTLEEKIAHYNPAAVCIVGKGIWDTIYKVKTGKTLKKGDFEYGWQEEALWLGRVIDNDGTVLSTGSRTFVSTSTSGLAAGMSTKEKTDIWTPLGEWLQQQARTVPSTDASSQVKVEVDDAGCIKVEGDEA